MNVGVSSERSLEIFFFVLFALSELFCEIMACEFTPKTQLIIAVINCSIGIIMGIIVCLVFGVLLENR